MLVYACESLYSPRFAPPQQCLCTLVSHCIHDFHLTAMLVYAGESLYSRFARPRQCWCTLVSHCIHCDLHDYGNAGVRW
ncbi:hypothetical protein DPMN_052723 [Dreissena polymorpha]|uniref:Uncharacterized protein n=1 Tax=Dreissena polymorpha TaxID=45954 RepID=A0A9D4HQ24_DREPO|nr:hypothetical protein DPMN_052723 [Dreissena polymorpha]